ncbi:hypothetical protein FY557_17625 [Chryseobacterium sp. SN22]|uniref:hypothetical protein n=1 Tax=Chryseobacterium sp. SN22 TaxID=2606431 RepID=UPI0011EF819C|nr:hypothetical protein [Chryseobacterium sp. SN22]KAA0126470.1 hypothetical protein FY557_17625 [Chryseobacterium sp. SN22]
MTIKINEYGKKYIDYKNDLYFIRIDRNDIKIFGNEENDKLLILDDKNILISKVKAKKGSLDEYLNKSRI